MATSSSSSSSGSMARTKSLIDTSVIVVSVVFPLLSLGAILLRYRARSLSKMGLKADDWTILVAWILSLGASIWTWVFASLAGVNYLKGDFLYALEKTVECLQVGSATWQFPLAVVKVSILLFYQRIFRTPRFALVVTVMIPIVIVWGLLFFFLVLFTNDPVRGAWTGEGHLRYNANALGLAQVGSSIGLDLLILSLPLPVIYRLHLPTGKKWVVATVFWLGAFCVIAATVRLVLLQLNTQRVINSGPLGFSLVYIQWNLFVFAFLEINCSIIAACLPCYGVLLAGGRSPESMIASVRSMLSLQSRRSASASNGTAKDDDVAKRVDSMEAGLNKTTVTNSINLDPVEDERSPIGHELYNIKVTREIDITAESNAGPLEPNTM